MNFIPIKKHLRKTKGIFFNQLLISFMLLAIAPVSVIFIISYNNYNSALAKQTESQNIFMVEQYNKNIEDNLSKLINETNRLLVDENINTFNATIEELQHSPQKVDAFLAIYDSLTNEQRTLYDTVDSIYLYYPKNGLFISNYGYYDKKEFYDIDMARILENNGISKFGYSVIHRKMRYPEGYSTSNRYLGDLLTVIRPMPFSNNGAFLVLNIKEEMFLHINNSDENIANIFLIADENGNEIFSTNALKNKYSHEIRINVLKSIPKTQKSGFFSSSGEPSLTVFYSQLNKFGLRTIMLFPNNYIYTDLNSLKLIITTIFLFTLSLSLVISYIISQKLYDPIKHLVSNMAKKNNSNEIIKNRNEFRYIEDKYNAIVKQNLEFSQKLSANLPLLKELFFKNILEGKINDIESINNRADFFGIDIKNAFTFTVYVILIENAYKFVNTDNLFQLHYLKETINNIIRNELNHGNMEILYVSTDDDMLILINWNKQSNNIISIPKRIYAAIKQQIPATIYISVGVTVSQITDLPYSYTTAIDAMNYIGIKDDENNIIYANDMAHPTKTVNYFSPEDEKQLLLSIINCDYKKAIDTFNRLISNILAQNISYECFQQIIIQILNDILKFMEGNSIPIVFIGRNLYKEVINIKTIKNTKDWMVNQLNEIINHIRDNKIDRRSVLAADIVNYIYANYDKNINLEIAADHFSLSRQYFSKIFYEEVGKSFNDYLNAVRLDMSLKYLKETDISIKDVAEKVGFNSSQYYIRLFKNKYGFTPAQYRNKTSHSHYTIANDSATKLNYNN